MLKQALGDVRVLDMSRLVAGNITSHVLADFGADVIKLETPSGDALRDWKIEGVPTHWQIYGRNKRSLGVDLRAPGSLDIVLRCIENVDILVENFRPGTLENMQLAPKTLLERNPNLVIVRISGFGQTGPYSSRPGFGTMIEAMSGFAALNGFADRKPVLPPMALADNFAGLYAANAAMIALHHVRNGGGGQVIDVPLFDPLFAMIGPVAADYEITGELQQRSGGLSTTIGAPRNTYCSRDGKWLALSAAMQSTVERLFIVIGRPDMIKDPRFSTGAERAKNVDLLDEIIGDFFLQYDLQELLKLMIENDITVAPVMSIDEIMQDPHVIARETIVRLPCGTLAHNVVPRMSATPGEIRNAAPELGQDTEAVLKTLGFDEEDVKAFLSARNVFNSEGVRE